MSYTVAQNTSFLTVASVLQKVISFVYFTVIARVIGVENTGQYFFAITFTTIFAVAADFGFQPVLTRETARFPENSEKYLNTVFWLKILYGAAAYGLVILFANLLRYGPELKQLIYLSGVTMFFDNIHSGFYGIFRARKNLKYEAAGVVGSQFLTLIIGSIALFNHWPLVWLIAAYTIPSFINVLYSGFFVRRVFALRLRFLWDKAVARAFVGMAVPFALAGIISRLYSYSDSIIMSKLLSKQELGWWSVPYKITFAFQFIPAALSASVYPAISALSVSEPKRIGELFEKSWRYLFTIIFPLVFGILAIAEPFMITVYGPSYAPSVAPLRILLFSLLFGYLGFITAALLNATNRQKTQTALMGAVLVVNLVLNLFLIPRFGINGAAAAAAVSNFLLCAGGFYFSRRTVAISARRLVGFANRTFWPAAIMGVSVYFLTLKINFIAAIPLGAAIYAFLLFLTGGLSVDLIKKIRNKVN